MLKTEIWKEAQMLIYLAFIKFIYLYQLKIRLLCSLTVKYKNVFPAGWGLLLWPTTSPLF